MPATEKKTKTNYKAFCIEVERETGMRVLPGVDPDNGLAAYRKNEDGSLTEVEQFATYRDAYHWLRGHGVGYIHGRAEGDGSDF